MRQVILASASAVRLALLEQAGVPVVAEAAAIDEPALKSAMDAEGVPAEACAARLAELKAMRISLRHPGVLVIGADQLLDCGGKRFDKPADLDAARDHLRALRGREHRLVTAAVAVSGGRRLWHVVTTATLSMRLFSDDFLQTYLELAGPGILDSVGAYRLEGMGVQLFDRIDGDYFTVLGLPLVPVLDFLRGQGVLRT
jgi:septum formation protein